MKIQHHHFKSYAGNFMKGLGTVLLNYAIIKNYVPKITADASPDQP
jgi:hypothetical protein